MKYYKEVVEYPNRDEFTIHARGHGASNDVLATVTDRVFADRIVDLLNADEAREGR